MEMPTERRQHTRFDKALPVVLRGAQVPVSEFSMKDLSRRGFRVETNLGLAVGEALGFEIQIPGAGLLEGKAKVRWATTPTGFGNAEAGLEITAMRWGQAGALTRYLEPVTDGVNLFSFLDTMLQCACAVVLFLVAKEIFSNRPDLLRLYTSWLTETGPLYFVIAAAGAGIVALLRR